MPVGGTAVARARAPILPHECCRLLNSLNHTNIYKIYKKTMLAEYYSNSIRGVPDSNIRKIGEFDKYSNTIREYSYQNNCEAILKVNVIRVYFNITTVFILILLQHSLVLSHSLMVGVYRRFRHSKRCWKFSDYSLEFSDQEPKRF